MYKRIEIMSMEPSVTNNLIIESGNRRTKRKGGGGGGGGGGEGKCFRIEMLPGILCWDISVSFSFNVNSD